MVESSLVGVWIWKTHYKVDFFWALADSSSICWKLCQSLWYFFDMTVFCYCAKVHSIFYFTYRMRRSWCDMGLNTNYGAMLYSSMSLGCQLYDRCYWCMNKVEVIWCPIGKQWCCLVKSPPFWKEKDHLPLRCQMAST